MVHLKLFLVAQKYIFLLMDHQFQDESKHLFNGLEESCPSPSQTRTKMWVALWRKINKIHEN
jgi:hypothetical protein